MAAERSVVDTNVLLAATEPGRPGHAAAVALLGGPARLAISPQIVREYLSVLTRPDDANGLGLTMAEATRNVGVVLERCDLLTEDAPVVQRLLMLLAAGTALGRQVHDANVVAVALVHGAGRIITDNVRHFARFADLIEIVPLA